MTTSAGHSARNVLVLEPGTSAAGAYFVPLAKWIVSKSKGWQVWAVVRRESLLEDQSEANLAKNRKVNGTQLFVGLTYAHRIAVFDVDGFLLKRSPFVLRVGHGPCSMALGPRFGK